MTRTRIFYATDLHASEKCFRKFLNAAKAYEVSVLILGGDLTGKMVIPIVEDHGEWKTEFMGVKTRIRTQREVDDLTVAITNSGYYPYLTNQEEMDMLNSSKDSIQELFMRLMLDQVRRWVSLAEERLAQSGIRLYMTGGNDDPMEIEPVLNGSKFVENPENRVIEVLPGIEMISCGYGNPTPWKCPRDIEEEALLQRIEGMASQVKNMEKAIFNLHVPPYDSGLDIAPELDENLKPVATPGVGLMMKPAGSTAVRTAIEKYQPMLGLHGHIHESRGSVRIGRTLCINPGSEYSEGFLRGVIVDLDEKGIKSDMMTTG